MNINETMLALLERGDEEFKVQEIKKTLQVATDRTARIILHILENGPEKFEEKIEREIHKLELKIEKEYRKMHKRLDSYMINNTQPRQDKISELKFEIAEMQRLAGM
jgi:hypothetical protein